VPSRAHTSRPNISIYIPISQYRSQFLKIYINKLIKHSPKICNREIQCRWACTPVPWRAHTSRPNISIYIPIIPIYTPTNLSNTHSKHVIEKFSAVACTHITSQYLNIYPNYPNIHPNKLITHSPKTRNREIQCRHVYTHHKQRDTPHSRTQHCSYPARMHSMVA